MSMQLAPTQLDLFGAVEATEAAEHQAAVTRQLERDSWRAQFERADWVAPWDCADGTPKGTVRSGWRCPDPACGQIELNAFLLSINHGFDPDIPGRQPWNGRCFRRRNAASQPDVARNIDSQEA